MLGNPSAVQSSHLYGLIDSIPHCHVSDLQRRPRDLQLGFVAAPHSKRIRGATSWTCAAAVADCPTLS